MIGVQKTVVYLNNLQELTVRFSKKLLVRFSKTDLQCVCVCATTLLKCHQVEFGTLGKGVSNKPCKRKGFLWIMER